jgi:hypothetical protein
MKNIHSVIRFGVLGLGLLAASTAFARSAQFGPLPPPPVEDGGSYAKFGPLPPPPVEDGGSFRLKFGPLPPPPVEDGGN